MDFEECRKQGNCRSCKEDDQHEDEVDIFFTLHD